MPRSYVDNAYNRSVGRVGMPVGSCVISSGGGGGSSRSSGGGYSGSSARYSGGSSATGGGSSSHSGSSSKTYVDNSYNRSVGRVGMPVGSCVISKGSSGGDRSSRPNSATTYDGFSSYSSSSKTYVDNAYNRDLGRVGLPHGSMVVSKSGSSQSRDYSRDSGIGASPKTLVSAGPNSSQSYYSRSSDTKTYVDNAYNRSLGRVGMPHGSMSVSRKGTSSSGMTASKSGQTYVDNALNRSLGRVGLPLGSCPVSRTSQHTQERNKLIEKLQQKEFDGIEQLEESEMDNLALLEALNHLNRKMEELEWKETSRKNKKPKTSKSVLRDYTGEKIEFQEIELRRKIGQGGFGDVYFAKWKGTAVAVKKLRVQRVSKRRLREFTDEVLTFCKLDHPNIVQFIGACVVTPNLAIVMEYMQTSLFDALHMDDSIDFSEEERLSILCQTVCGLQYLHHRKMAHCDLKSQNVLLDCGDTVTAKITDFGLSMIKADTETSQSTAEELVRNIGTPRYSAPEILRGLLLSVRGMMRADIYSLSLIMYEVLFQAEPFYNLNYAQLRKQVGEMGKTPDIPDGTAVKRKLMKMLNWCWEYDPYKRPEIGEVYDFITDMPCLYKSN